MGDDGLFLIFGQMLKQRLASLYPQAEVIFNTTQRLNRAQGMCNFTDVSQFAVLGGGSNIGEMFVRFEPLQNAVHKGHPMFVFGSGYDDAQVKMSENELKMLQNNTWQNASRPLFELGKRRHNPYQRQIDILQHHNVSGGIRGPLTLRFLQAARPGFQIPITYDAGLVAEKYYPVTEAMKQDMLSRVLHLTQQEVKQKPIVVLNVGETGTTFGSKRTDSLKQVLSDIAVALSDKYWVVMYLIWPKDLAFTRSVFNEAVKAYERRASKAIADASKSSSASPKPRVPILMLQDALSLPEILTLTSLAHFTVGFKLHANIFSAATRTPPIMLAYRMKGLDFMNSVELAEYALKTNELTVKALLGKVELLERDRRFVLRKLDRAIKVSSRLYDQAMVEFMDRLRLCHKDQFAFLSKQRKLRVTATIQEQGGVLEIAPVA